MKLPSTTEGIVIYDERGLHYHAEASDLDLAEASAIESGFHWLVDLKTKNWITPDLNCRPLTTAPSQIIGPGQHWYLYGDQTSVWGGYEGDDSELYDVTIDLETGDCNLILS